MYCSIAGIGSQEWFVRLLLYQLLTIVQYEFRLLMHPGVVKFFSIIWQNFKICIKFHYF